MDQTSVYAAITKTAPQADGSLMVYGKATGSDLDLDEQRCDPAWLKTAMPEWLRGPYGGNIRESHDAKRAVGKATQHEVTETGDHMITARILDPVAQAKVEAGILSGFSIGIKAPRISKSADAPNGLLVGGQVIEVSLVDRPCLPTATLTICKAATPGMEVNASDFDESRGLVKCEELSLTEDAETAPEVAEKTVTVPSPLDMPGAKKALAESGLLGNATDVAELDAPAPGQTCVRCAEPGHLWCAPEGFDKDFAVGLVSQVIDKGVGSLTGAHADAEASDIDNATQAIAIISQLICSEASELAGQPSEAMDIAILLDAVASLQCFIRREQSEQTDITPDMSAADMVSLAATPDVGKKSKYDAAQMAQMLKDGSAMANPNGDPSYPIKDAEDLENAIHAVGRGKGDHNAIRSHIVKRAQALGLESKLPDDWTKAVTPDVEKGRTVTFELDGKSYTATLNDEPTPDEAVKTATSDVVEPAETVEVEKAVTPETPVDAEQADTEKSTAPDLVKTLTGALKDETSELRELFKSLLRDDTTAKALETTQVTLGDISARLERVEQMAAPGGPALRRTEVEVKKSRQSDLLLQADTEERKAAAAHDVDLRQGYLAKAMDLRAEARALAA